MSIIVLTGGVGGSRFTRGLRDLLRRRGDPRPITVISNTGDDFWLDGLRLCPDLDTMLYTLGDGIDEDQGWGRRGDTGTVSEELAAYGMGLPWFTLGDRDLGTHIARTALLRSGLTLTEATAHLARRWRPGARLLPMCDEPFETHVRVADDVPGGPVAGELLHFEEWWVRYRAGVPVSGFVPIASDGARASDAVLGALATAHAVLVAPSNPVVSIGPILQVPGLREALLAGPAPIVGISPVIGGNVVRGMADACLAVVGVATDAAAIARHYGRRGGGGVLDGWLVGEEDAETARVLTAEGLPTRSVPLWMRGAEATERLAADALDLAGAVRRSGSQAPPERG